VFPLRYNRRNSMEMYSRPYLQNRIVDAKQEHGVEAKPLGLLVPVSCTRYRASTSGLSTQ
jgi:hypothetical protein